MTSLMKNVVGSLIGKAGLRTALAAATLGVMPAAALAGHHDGGLRIGIDIHAGPTIERVRVPAPPPPPTVYEDRQVQVWVEPVYRTVTDRQWVPPVYRTVSERVLVPERCEYRDVVCYERGRRQIYRERVVVEPARYQAVQRQELVCDGHWETFTHQELVSPGHYETRVERVAVPCP